LPVRAPTSLGSILSACSNKVRAASLLSFVSGCNWNKALPRIVRSTTSGFLERVPFSASALTSSMPNHKLSATFFGGEVKYTKRYRLAQLLSQLTRHFLLMTATPHNGKEEDFQLFMALLDGDRFEGKFRDGVHTADVWSRLGLTLPSA
jgi:hypothetical protein